MDKENIQALSKVRLEQAKENLEEAEILFDLNKFKGASNRAYYSIFHAIKSILALKQKDFKKHSSVLAYFNKEYTNNGIFDKELGRRINKASFYREKSDYEDFYIVTKDACKAQIETAKLVIKEAEKYINEKIK